MSRLSGAGRGQRVRSQATIEAGRYQPRRSIPSEAQITQIFGVARETARRAVAELRERGYVYTVPQRGTFVVPPEERPAR
jgi:DNA-binding GntR family transcriptional regulator